mgnify:CR=1 FL=1
MLSVQVSIPCWISRCGLPAAASHQTSRAAQNHPVAIAWNFLTGPPVIDFFDRHRINGSVVQDIQALISPDGKDKMKTLAGHFGKSEAHRSSRPSFKKKCVELGYGVLVAIPKASLRESTPEILDTEGDCILGIPDRLIDSTLYPLHCQKTSRRHFNGAIRGIPEAPARQLGIDTIGKLIQTVLATTGIQSAVFVAIGAECRRCRRPPVCPKKTRLRE